MSRPDTHLALSAAAVLSLAGLALAAPDTATAGANQVCCENENGNYHPVSTNGKAADDCVQTWDIPDDEVPGQYCALGPQDLTPIEECGYRDAAFCFDPSPYPDEYYCYLAVGPGGNPLCCALVFAGDEPGGCL